MKITRYPKQNAKTEYIGSSWSGLNQGYQRTLDSITSYSDGRYTITMPGENQLVFANQTGASAVSLIEKTHYQYEKRIDASTSQDAADGYGTIAGGVIDVSTSGNLDTGKLFRVVHGNYNIVSDFQPSGNLKVYAKDLGVIEYTPPPDRIYLDPKTGKMIFPRPVYMNRCSNISTVDYPDIKSHLNPTSSIHPYTYTSSGVNGNAYMLYRVANQGGSYTSYINPFTGNTLASDFVASFWAYNVMWNRNKDNNTGYSGETLFFLNENTYIGKYCYSPNNVETYRHVVVVNGSTVVDSSAGAAWYHFFVSSNGTTTKFYFNSTLVYTHTGTITLNNPYFVMWVATTDAGSHDGYVYTGLDNIKIWENAYSYEAAMLAIEYNSGAGNETALHPRYGLENSYIPNLKAGFNYIPNSVTNAVLPKPTGANAVIQIENVSDYSNGVGYFGIGHRIYDTDYTVLAEGTDYVYDEAWDGSGTHAIDKYDDGVSGSFSSGKVARIVNNISGTGLNISDATGLNLIPVCKKMITDNFTPPKTQVYIDPLKGKFVLPRPIYWSKCESFANLISPEIGAATYESTIYASLGTSAGKFGNGCGVATTGAAFDHWGRVYIYPTLPSLSEVTISFWNYMELPSQSYDSWDWATAVWINSTTYISIYAHKTGTRTVSLVINEQSVASATATFENVWKHVFLTVTSTNVSLWVNGSRLINYTGTFTIGTVWFNFSSYQYTNIGSTNNLFDNIKIWRDALTIPDLEYNSGTGREDALHEIYGSINGFKPNLVSPGGVGYYKASGAGSLVRGTI